MRRLMYRPHLLSLLPLLAGYPVQAKALCTNQALSPESLVTLVSPRLMTRWHQLRSMLIVEGKVV